MTHRNESVKFKNSKASGNEVMAEEEDYMSDCFLNQAKDIRPGLRTGRQKRKEHSSKTRDPSRVKRVKTEAQERREEGLATPLSKDNKGFSLLQKMGYKKGMGLGKSGV